MKGLQVSGGTLAARVAVSLMLFAACAKDKSTPAVPPATTAASIEPCSAEVIASKADLDNSCHIFASLGQIQVCIVKEKTFVAKYPFLTCQVQISTANAAAGTLVIISSADISAKIDQDSKLLASATSNGVGEGTGGGGLTGTGAGVGVGPAASPHCDAQTSGTYSNLMQTSSLPGHSEFPCANVETLDQLKRCYSAWSDFKSQYPNLNCNFVDSSGHSTILDRAVLERFLLAIEFNIDQASQNPANPGGATPHLKFCDAKTTADTIRLRSSCYQNALSDPAQEINRKKACLDGDQQFVSLYPKLSCELPVSAGSLYQLIISSDKLNEQIKLLKEALAN